MAAEPGGGALEYQLKAAFLLNFVRFVEWPADGAPATRDRIEICLAGGDPFGPVLDATLEGKTVRGQAVVVRRMAAGEAPTGCSMLFIAGSDMVEVAGHLRPAKGQPMLTVGESAGFAPSGGAIGFFIEEKRIRFEVNVDVVQQSGLTVSSRLLDLARIVHSQEKPRS